MNEGIQLYVYLLTWSYQNLNALEKGTDQKAMTDEIHEEEVSGPAWKWGGSRIELTNGNWWLIQESGNNYSADLMSHNAAIDSVKRNAENRELSMWHRRYYEELLTVAIAMSGTQ